MFSKIIKRQIIKWNISKERIKIIKGQIDDAKKKKFKYYAGIFLGILVGIFLGGLIALIGGFVLIVYCFFEIRDEKIKIEELELSLLAEKEDKK